MVQYTHRSKTRYHMARHIIIEIRSFEQFALEEVVSFEMSDFVLIQKVKECLRSELTGIHEYSTEDIRGKSSPKR
jgi:hypothetical protein